MGVFISEREGGEVAFCFSLMLMSVLRWLCWVPSVECLLTFLALRVYWREALTAVCCLVLNGPEQACVLTLPFSLEAVVKLGPVPGKLRKLGLCAGGREGSAAGFPEQ